MARIFGLVVVFAATRWGGEAAHAQTSSIQVFVQVSDILASIRAVNDLEFGVVLPGETTTISPQLSVSAGKYQIGGVRGAEFTLSVTLPVVLRAGAGPYTMPISFGSAAGCRNEVDDQAHCAFYDPATTLTERIRDAPPPGNSYFVWLGGSVSPAADQVPGVYSATVTAAVAYTGN